jgi:hypothetical protein
VFIYVEYISRRPGVTIEEFRGLTGYTQPRWSALFPEDKLLLNLGRTWRIGAEPEYMAVWFNASSSLERLDQWARTFTDQSQIPELPVIEHAFLTSARIESAGALEPLGEPSAGQGPAYYVESFSPGASTSGASLREAFERRTLPGTQLHLLARRIGLLGPDPGLAIWGAESFEALEGVVRGAGVTDLAQPVRGALYANLGQEVL